MNENYLCSDFSNYGEKNLGFEAEKIKPRNAKVLKVLKILFCTLAVVLVIEGFAYFVILPSTSDCTVMFTGLQTLDADELGRTLSLYCGTDWFRFDTAAAAAHISSNSAVESVSVEKRFPDRIFIDIKERVPVAITFATVNSMTIPVLIDESGVLFTADTEIITSSFPLITGLEFDTFVDGMRLDSRFYPLFQQVADIQKNKPSYFSVISEIQVISKAYDNYELVIYPIHSKTRVLVDRNLDEKSIEHMLIALDVANNINPGVPELDLRYGSISYKMNTELEN